MKASHWIYYIPAIGWVVSVVNYIREAIKFERSRAGPFSKEAKAQWQSFENNGVALMSFAVGGLLFAIVELIFC